MFKVLQRGLAVSDREISNNRVYHPQASGTPAVVAAPTLVLMAGFAGVGKTTLAQELHEIFKWRVLDKDKLKYTILAEGKKQGVKDADWSAFVEQAGWDAFVNLLDQVQTALANRESLIVDTSNEKPLIFEDIKKIREQLKRDNIYARLLIILCIADKGTRTKRLKKRGSVFWPYVTELPTILDDSELRERFNHLFKEDNVIFVNTALPLNKNVRDVSNQVNVFLRRNGSIARR